MSGPRLLGGGRSPNVSGGAWASARVAPHRSWWAPCGAAGPPGRPQATLGSAKGSELERRGNAAQGRWPNCGKATSAKAQPAPERPPHQPGRPTARPPNRRNAHRMAARSPGRRNARPHGRRTAGPPDHTTARRLDPKTARPSARQSDPTARPNLPAARLRATHNKCSCRSPHHNPCTRCRAVRPTARTKRNTGCPTHPVRRGSGQRTPHADLADT